LSAYIFWSTWDNTSSILTIGVWHTIIAQGHADAAGTVAGAQVADAPPGLRFIDSPGNKHELVTAHAEHGDVTGQILHTLGGLADELVTHFMALGVIGLFEAIEVAEDKGQGHPVGQGPEIFGKAPTVADTSHLVRRAEALEGPEDIAVAQHDGQEQGQRR
jgi:hypothetical protein